MANNYLYIFLDEGGNLDFSGSGTKYFTLTSARMVRPFLISHILIQLKYDLIEYGLDFEYFHCTKNNKYVRERVFGILEDNIDRVCIDSLLIEKRKTGPALQPTKQFYPRMLGYLLRYIVNGINLDEIAEIIVITDTIPVQKKRAAVEKAVKVTLKAMLPASCRFRVLHHSSKSNIGLQIADYCNWAVYRKWETGDDTHFEKIRKGMNSCYDLFQSGTTYYY